MLTGGVWLYISFTYYSGYLGLLGLYWFPFVLITPGLCMLEAKVFSIIDKNIFGKKVIPLVEKIGAASFEIYLVHIAMFSLVVNVYFLNTAMLWKLWIPLAVIGGIIYKLMIEFCKKILKKRSRI